MDLEMENLVVFIRVLIWFLVESFENLVVAISYMIAFEITFYFFG